MNIVDEKWYEVSDFIKWLSYSNHLYALKIPYSISHNLFHI